MPDEIVSSAPHVDGRAIVYRLHDVGYAIALDRASQLLGDATRGPSRPGRGEARAIQIRNPPLFIALGACEVTVGSAALNANLSARLFDFGVCSLQLHVGATPGLSWDEFAAFGSSLGASSQIAGIFDAALKELLASINPAVERPQLKSVTEEYIVFRIDRLNDASSGKPVRERISNEQLLRLLLGESRPLSSDALRELVPHRFSYYDDDLTVLTWDNALVVEPRADDQDVEYVLEFANAQLLELRMYDLELDAELPALYDRVEAARRRRRRSARIRQLLSDLQTRVADITETVERVENALKTTNDVYLARVYAAALELFREKTWRAGIERKLAILRETYAMLNSEAQAARAELLEVAIVVLIVVELLLALLRGG